MQSALIFLVVISVLVFVHELGHFLVARIFGVGVRSFALGFPPTLYSRKVGETVYKINAIPLGGYVSLVGETDDESEPGKWRSDQSLENKVWWQKIMILSAGIVMNFILAIVLFCAISVYYNGLSGFVSGYAMYTNIIGQTVAGLVAFLGQVFVHADVSSVSGPVGIAQILGQASQSGFDQVVFLTAVLSVNLGLLNLIPFPALDGGQIVVVLIEKIIRRKLPPVVANVLTLAGFAALLLLSVIVSWHDIAKLL